MSSSAQFVTVNNLDTDSFVLDNETKKIKIKLPEVIPQTDGLVRSDFSVPVTDAFGTVIGFLLPDNS